MIRKRICFRSST